MEREEGIMFLVAFGASCKKMCTNNNKYNIYNY